MTFDNANEKAIGGSIAYEFGAFGLSGLSTGVWYTHGWDAINTRTNSGIPNRSELDLWIQYRPTEGPLKGFRLKMQYENVWQQGNVRNTQPEFQFIVDYTVLFRPAPLQNRSRALGVQKPCGQRGLATGYSKTFGPRKHGLALRELIVTAMLATVVE